MTRRRTGNGHFGYLPFKTEAYTVHMTNYAGSPPFSFPKHDKITHREASTLVTVSRSQRNTSNGLNRTPRQRSCNTTYNWTTCSAGGCVGRRFRCTASPLQRPRPGPPRRGARRACMVQVGRGRTCENMMRGWTG